MRLGTQDKDFFPQDLVEKFKFVKAMGFECFEIDGKVLTDHVDMVKKAIEESGLPVSSACGGYRGWIGDFIEERRENGVEDLKEIIRALKEVGGKGVVVPAAWGMFTFRLPPMTPPRSHEGDVKAILASLKELDAVAEENGIYLYLEPLNRYQDHMLNTLQDAMDIIEMGQFKMVKITADFYHMAIEEDDISESLMKFRDAVGHVHIAENHRYQPGTGSIDWKRHIQTLKDIGYEGDVVNEGRIRGENPLEVYQKSVDFMKQFL
ncbi:sugar phosphate isomerase/epimerase [Faecalicatena orotica]|uniref:Sugar phosphate isomerase/epimerase n=1 Tax=Faecalicatena orotica TaxID=1544 RepID=A0A2Y9B979_9FIRM|nr:sugar phosphate isomerase/epimerase [Faecalicatena orotica]PWJ31224.1 sugar phosphate isomerase/epimerase [Faecalicatena orotica]SSA54430.1 Sugar phosphate isomerase/epimerase [Faecalicatena orotica]